MRVPRTAGARALIWILDRSSSPPTERTRPITPALDAAYNGAVGNAYNPAFEAVHIIDPLEIVPSPRGFLFM